MLLFNRYDYNPATDLIGKGGFCRVYKAQDKRLNRTVALKIYKSGELAEKYSPIAEIQRVIDFDHPNISRYIDIEEVQKEDAFGELEKIQVCVMEYLDGGNLANFYQANKNPHLFRQLLLDVLRGLVYLHQQGVIHRDIKPANILIKNTARGPVAKITDFGISKRSDNSFNSTASSLIVSIPYMAPEQLNAQKYGIDENISYNIDLWMLGVTVYEIVADDVLFRNDPQDASEQIMANIMQPDIPEKVNNLPEPFRQFVQTCLVKDARQRVKTADELIELLQQPFTAPAPVDPVETNDADTDATQVVAPSLIAEAAALHAPVTDDTMIISGSAAVLPQPASDDTLVLDRNVQTPVSANKASEPVAAEQPAIPPAGKKEKPVNLFNRYDYYPISDCIGKGGFSRVYKAFDKKLSRWVALKIYKTGEFSERYSPIAEIKRVVNLDHPNICRYLDMEEIENKNPFGENEIIQICVMELLDSGNILEYYKKHEDQQLLIKLVRDILNGLAYLHRHGIIHRDIKPANILIKSALEGPVAKITDFGISKATDNINSNSSSALVVSIPYMAPEQLNIKKYGIDEKIASNLDLWSLGVTIYEIITGKVLFKNNDRDSSEQVMANIMSPRLPEKINELPEPFRKIVSLCVVKNARDRVQKAEALLQILESAVSNDDLQTNSYKNDINDNAGAGGLFLGEQEVDTVFYPKKKKIALRAKTKLSVPALTASFINRLQQVPAFFKTHLMKLIIGTSIVLLVTVMLLTVQYFNNHRANSSLPVGSSDSVANKPPAHIAPAAASASKAPDTTTTVTPVNETAKTKTTGAENVATKKKKEVNSKRQEERERDIQQTTHTNERAMVTISSTRPCSLRIVSAANGYNESIPSLQDNFQIPMHPGTYTVTAVNLRNRSETCTGILIVKSGRKIRFSVPWQ